MRNFNFLCIFLLFVCPGWSQQEDSLPPQKADTTLIAFSENNQDSIEVVGSPVIGRAGMYSSRADGSITASGERFDNSLFTAASNKFKLDTWVKVTNLKNRHWVLVRINDRTSRRPGAAIIEISRAAVVKLGFLRTGEAKVKIEKIAINNLKSINNDTLQKSIPPVDTVQLSARILADSFRLTGKVITGIASFYSAKLDGTLTATGERYRNNKLTAASNNFPLNTWVLVTNLRNQKSVIVRINDRMHPRMKKKGRVVDMSGSAARELDMLKAGIVKVTVEVLQFIKPPADNKADSIVLTDSLSRLDTLHSDTAFSEKFLPDNQAKEAESFVTGLASIYSSKLDGATTSSGEIYRNKKLSAACNDFPLRSRVKVTNLKNNRSVVLRINDRIHLKRKAKGRVIDLSSLAAQKIGILQSGTTRVKVVPEPKGTLN